MAHRGLHVYVRCVDQVDQGLEFRFGHIGLEILALCERPDADGVTVGRDHGNRLADMLGCRAVHDDAGAGLDSMN